MSILSKAPDLPHDPEAEDTPCRFHPEEQAVAFEGFAPMCVACYRNWLKFKQGTA